MGDGNGYFEYFISPSRGRRDFSDVINDIVEFINEDDDSKYCVVVGSDSEETTQANPERGREGTSRTKQDAERVRGFVRDTQRASASYGTNGHPSLAVAESRRAGIADFVSVVTVHRVGKHGRFFWKKMSGLKIFDRHDRMLKEAYFSLELAQRVVAELRNRLSERLYDFEIHLDIGHNGPTRTMIQEIVGMITGNGFVARIKPESYAASKVADRYV